MFKIGTDIIRISRIEKSLEKSGACDFSDYHFNRPYSGIPADQKLH